MSKSTDTSKVQHVHHDHSYTSGMYTFYIFPKMHLLCHGAFFSLATMPTFKRYTGVNTIAHITLWDLFIDKMHELFFLYCC